MLLEQCQNPPPPRLPDCKSNVDFPIFKRRILIIVPEVWRMEESLSDLGHDGDVGRGGRGCVRYWFSLYVALKT